MKKILLLDGHSPATLSILRSLSRGGHRVDLGIDLGSFFLCGFSRYAQEKVVYPSPAKNVGEFLEYFVNLINENKYDYIFPVTDRTIVPLHFNRSTFRHFHSLVLPPHDPLECTLDKKKTLELAGRLGIPQPTTFSAGGRAELEAYFPAGEGKNILDDSFAEFRFPVVVKACRSKIIEDGKLISDSEPLFANSREELVASWEKKNREIPRPLIQEYIPGDGYGIFVLMREGEPMALFAHHRLREEEPMGARSSYCESIAPPPIMKEYALNLLREIKWTGPAMVEFKLDRRDNIPKLMEINGRFWGSLPLSVAAGVDFPSLYLQMLRQDCVLPSLVAKDFSPPSNDSPNVVRDFPVKRTARVGIQTRYGSPAYSGPADCDYKIGLKARYLYADIKHLINVFHGPPYDWITDYPSRGKTLLKFMLSFFTTNKYFNLDLRDPLPGIVENYKFIKTKTRQLFGQK